MDRQGWADILPSAGAGLVGQREGYPEHERNRHREHAGVRSRVGDDCVSWGLCKEILWGNKQHADSVKKSCHFLERMHNAIEIVSS
jgi:hypothetical protein